MKKVVSAALSIITAPLVENTFSEMGNILMNKRINQPRRRCYRRHNSNTASNEDAVFCTFSNKICVTKLPTQFSFLPLLYWHSLLDYWQKFGVKVYCHKFALYSYSVNFLGPSLGLKIKWAKSEEFLENLRGQSIGGEEAN